MCVYCCLLLQLAKASFQFSNEGNMTSVVDEDLSNCTDGSTAHMTIEWTTPSGLSQYLLLEFSRVGAREW